MKRLSNRLAAIVLVLIAAGGLSIALQGWRSRMPTWDLLQSIWDADELIRHGHIPVQGVLSSFLAFVPPGTAWLMAPGLLLSNDPRTFEWVATGALHLMTLWGIFALTRRAFGPAAAYLAVVLYGFSQVGLFYAVSLWPRGHPCFYVWMVYWLQRWAMENRPSALAIAAAIWGVGMYVMMEIAPAILLVPVFWMIYRPRVGVASLAMAFAVCFLVWLPYLSFQSGRDFQDLRAILARRPLYANGLPDGYREAWCNPDLQFARADAASSGTQGTADSAVVVPAQARGLLRKAASRAADESRVILRNAAGNFELATTVAGAQFILLSLCGLALLALGMRSLRIRRLLNWRPDLLPRRLAPIRSRLLELGTLADADSRGGGAAAFLGAALAVPWVVLLLITDADRTERFWWLWPLQLIVLAGTLMLILRRSQALRLAAALLLLLIVWDTTTIANRVTSWTTDGWGGRDADEARVVDYIAGRLTGRAAPKIGYQIYFAPFMPRYHSLEKRYRVGAAMDVMLEHRYGLRNADRCGEGFAPDDDYRVVQTEAPGGLHSTRFDLPLDARFAPLQEFGRFTVFERRREAVATR